MINYLILIEFSMIIIFYVAIDIIFRKQIAILFNQLNWKKSDQRYILLGLFFVVSKFVKNTSSLLSSEAQKSIKYFYPVKYYKFYETLFICKKIGVCILCLEVSLFLSFVNNIYLLSVLGLFFSILMYFLMDMYMSNKFVIIKNNIQLELPKLLTKLSLLIDSGINYRDSIDLIIDNGNGSLYDELGIIKALIDNGKNEKEAYSNLARISEDMLVKKFISMILQNIYKGDEDFSINLKELKKESFEQKKNFIINKTQKAGQKLLFPNLIIFMGIMIMVMIPILLNAF